MTVKKLMIRQFGGTNIARVSQDATGQLTLIVLVPELAEELQAMFSRLSVGPLPLRRGRRLGTPQGIAHETVVRQVSPTDPDFLAALSDRLVEERIGGKRVRGVLMER
jgi:hypothetical protein